MKHRLSGTIVSTVSALLLACGCSKDTAPEFVKAKITIHVTFGIVQPGTKLVTDATEVKRLAQFFPGLGKRRLVLEAASWVPTGTIEFFHPDQESVTVEFGSQLKLWTDGQGDRPLAAGFKPFLAELMKEQEIAPGSP